MRNTVNLIIGILMMNIIIYACTSSPTTDRANDEYEHQEGHDDHEGEEHAEGIVSLTQMQMDAIGLQLLSVEKRNMNIAVKVTGKLDLEPQDKADISPVLGGIVKQINVFEGDKVAKGQVLAILEHPDYIQLQQDYLNNLNTQQYLQKEYERQKKLYAERVGSGKDFQKISADYSNNKAATIALEAKLNMLGLNAKEIAKGTIYPTLNIVSPMRGKVSLVETNVGAYAEPLSKLFEVVNNDKLHADLMVYEKDISKIKLGQKVYFSTSSLPGIEMAAKIYAISPAFENDPKAIHVHAKITNKKRSLIPGMYIHGRIIADNVLTSVVPDHAIVVEEGKSYIFIKTNEENHDDHNPGIDSIKNDEDNHDDNGNKDDEHGHDDHDKGKWTFEMVEVIPGISDGGYVQIKLLSPLPEGAQIAGNSAYYLLAEKDKGETEHAH